MCLTVRFSTNILLKTFRCENLTALKPFISLLLPKRRLSSNIKNGKEVRIPTPYGHIAGKEYGDPKGHPVLAVHGWLDNCGTFELLMPHIVEENNLHVIAIDQTGCGLSSHLPPGAEYPKLSMAKDIKLVVDHLQWKNYSLLGHSRGAVISLFYAAMFPETVQSVVAVDPFPGLFAKENYPYTGQDAMVLEKHLSVDEKSMNNPNLDETAPVFSEEEAIKKVMTAITYSGLTQKTARILMKRGTKSHKNGLIFTRDLRQTLPIMGLPSEANYLEFVSKLRCDLLVLMPTIGAPHQFPPDAWFKIFKNNCRTFKNAIVRGKHYIHMDSAEEVASIINPFIEESILKGPIADREFL